MHGLVKAQSLPVGPADPRLPAALRHLLRIPQRLEGDVFRARLGLGAGNHIRQREAPPRDHHRPRFHAAEAVHPVLHHRRFDEVLELVVAGLVAEAVHLDGPRPRNKGVGPPGRIRLVEAELVEVVVSGDFFPGVGLFVLGIRAGRIGVRGGRAAPHERRRTEAGRGTEKLAAVDVDALGGDFRGRDVALLLDPDDHSGPPCGRGARPGPPGAHCMIGGALRPCQDGARPIELRLADLPHIHETDGSVARVPVGGRHGAPVICYLIFS